MILRITLIGLMAGVLGTGLGGVLSGIFKKKVDKYIDFFMGLSGGIMLAVVVFDLMKEAIEQKGIFVTVSATFLGVVITMLIKENLHMCELAITFLKKYVYDVLENTGKYSVSYDIWEENDRGIHMYSLASIFSAFDTMKKIYKALGKNVSDFENNRLKEEKINKNIKEIDELMLKVKEYIEQNLYDENRKSYVRNTEDRRIDISLLGAVYPFNVFSPKEKKVLNTVENINLTLRTYTGGYQRFEYDHYRDGAPWAISNLWMTLYYLEIGEKKKAKETFDFVLKTVGKHSFLGEQVDN